YVAPLPHFVGCPSPLVAGSLRKAIRSRGLVSAPTRASRTPDRVAGRARSFPERGTIACHTGSVRRLAAAAVGLGGEASELVGGQQVLLLHLPQQRFLERRDPAVPVGAVAFFVGGRRGLVVGELFPQLVRQAQERVGLCLVQVFALR